MSKSLVLYVQNTGSCRGGKAETAIFQSAVFGEFVLVQHELLKLGEVAPVLQNFSRKIEDSDFRKRFQQKDFEQNSFAPPSSSQASQSSVDLQHVFERQRSVHSYLRYVNLSLVPLLLSTDPTMICSMSIQS
ncbi:hypothetical protein Y032_0312g2165 [Ancylostoma ceylanicum]|uniref:Uncharacterized protein n=1 Tax=Ancylostoma ceylanicum TaxID=53326 RepID=A0A016S2U8_9BILA|nr:hypothetical protein Y032_0312g2165 [Ancylostoma ceylanicum]